MQNADDGSLPAAELASELGALIGRRSSGGARLAETCAMCLAPRGSGGGDGFGGSGIMGGAAGSGASAAGTAGPGDTAADGGGAGMRHAGDINMDAAVEDNDDVGADGRFDTHHRRMQTWKAANKTSKKRPKPPRLRNGVLETPLAVNRVFGCWWRDGRGCLVAGRARVGSACPLAGTTRVGRGSRGMPSR